MITIESTTLVNLINNLIEEAVCDGAPFNTAYHQNTLNLITATNNLLNYLGLSRYYEVIETNDYANWSIVKVVERKNMGLDLMLHRISKDIKKDSKFSYWNVDVDNELAYGRKTWGIYYFFRNKCEEVGYEAYRVTPEAWQDFMDYFEDWDIPRITQVIDDAWRLGNKYDWNAADADYIVDFVDGMGEGQLGYEWDARAMLDWRDADKEVQDAFANGDEVIMLASY